MRAQLNRSTAARTSARAVAAALLAEMSPTQLSNLESKCPATAARVSADLRRLLDAQNRDGGEKARNWRGAEHPAVIAEFTQDEFNAYLATDPPRWEGRPGRDPFVIRMALAPQRQREFRDYCIALLDWDEQTPPHIYYWI